MILALCYYLQGKAWPDWDERLVVEHNFAVFNLYISHCLHIEAWSDCVNQCCCLVITYTARHGHNENAGAGLWSLLARQGTLSWMSCSRTSMARLSWTLSPCAHGRTEFCLSIIPCKTTHVAEHNFAMFCLFFSHCLHSKAWQDC